MRLDRLGGGRGRRRGRARARAASAADGGARSRARTVPGVSSHARPSRPRPAVWWSVGRDRALGKAVGALDQQLSASTRTRPRGSGARRSTSQRSLARGGIPRSRFVAGTAALLLEPLLPREAWSARSGRGAARAERLGEPLREPLERRARGCGPGCARPARPRAPPGRRARSRGASERRSASPTPRRRNAPRRGSRRCSRAGRPGRSSARRGLDLDRSVRAGSGDGWHSCVTRIDSVKLHGWPAFSSTSTGCSTSRVSPSRAPPRRSRSCAATVTRSGS